jgi:diguanylate cyclase
MSFGDNEEKASDLAKQAIELMDQKGVPAAPPNYAVWYNYVSDRFPDLKKTLDQMIETDQAFDGIRNQVLYDTFLGHTQEGILLQDAGEEMREEVGQVLGVLDDASSEMAGFSSSIKDNLDNFSTDKSAGGIEAFVQNMMLETRRIQEKNDFLQTQLMNSSEKIADLQENLQKAQEESYTDALTGIANRKKFDVTLVAEMAEAQKSGRPLCLVVGDIDHFKKFNDSFGHQIGDQVLKLVARALHDNVKGGDLAARYGGEEFALILPATGTDPAFGLVESIRKTIASRRITNRQKGQDFGSVTLSLGLALYREGEAASDFIARADGAMYRAKQAGRNQTVCDTEHALAE